MIGKPADEDDMNTLEECPQCYGTRLEVWQADPPAETLRFIRYRCLSCNSFQDTLTLTPMLFEPTRP